MGTMAVSTSVIWFRNDLRLEDHPALAAAVSRGGPVLPVFIWAPEDEGASAPGAASRWWLHQSLTALAGQLEALGARLIVRKGRPADVLVALAVAERSAACPPLVAVVVVAPAFTVHAGV